MGQTLTHGVYLPDEGERNCYSGLAANWQILDTSVGTIAEHTTQIAGKAPAVHTHTKADITDFPVYGTTAGTICEGNDSRLSDARTPVAHTHTKSDVTDLFNSANVWSANNTYSADCIIYNSDNSGSVAGLKLRNSKAEVLSSANTSSSQLITFRDKNDFVLGYIRGAVQSTSIVAKIGANAIDSSNNTVNTELQIIAFTNGTKTIFPTSDADVNLGITTHRWKSFNGLNPGALSLPDLDNTYRWSLDTTNWVLDGSANNTFTPNFSGWLNIRIPDVAGNYIIMQSGSITVSNQGTGALASTITRPLSLLIPVIEGVSGLVRVNAASITGYFYPALGNPIKTTQPSS